MSKARRSKKRELMPARVVSPGRPAAYTSMRVLSRGQVEAMARRRGLSAVPTVKVLPPPPPVRKHPTGAEIMERVRAEQLAPRPKGVSRWLVWPTLTAAERQAFRQLPGLRLRDRLGLALHDDRDLRERDELELRARAEAPAAPDLPPSPPEPSPEPPAPPEPVAPDLLDPEALAAEVNYEVIHPERREKWIAEWVSRQLPDNPQRVVESTRAVWDPKYPRPLLIHTTVPAPWERSIDERAAEAYDHALRSGEVRKWWATIEAAEGERAARWLAEMARKHPGADPSTYGILAIQDADREKEARAAARGRGFEEFEARRAKEAHAEIERATRAKYGIPKGVPVLPPKPSPEPIDTRPTNQDSTTPPPTGVVLSNPGIRDTGFDSPINSAINSPTEPRRGEPAIAVSPKASREPPSAGGGALRGPLEGSEAVPPTAQGPRGPRDGSEPVPPVPSLPERHAGRPRLYNFDRGEARWLKSLGFTVAEIVRMLGLPDTESARALVRAAVRDG